MSEIFTNEREQSKDQKKSESRETEKQVLQNWEKKERLKGFLETEKMTEEWISALRSKVDKNTPLSDQIPGKQAIFTKIEESQGMSAEIAEFFDTVTGIEDVLPKDLQITKKEYIAALTDEAARVAVAEKTEYALNFIANSHSPRSSWPLGTFLSFVSIRSKNVVRVQESYIDIKRSLSQ